MGGERGRVENAGEGMRGSFHMPRVSKIAGLDDSTKAAASRASRCAVGAAMNHAEAEHVGTRATWADVAKVPDVTVTPRFEMGTAGAAGARCDLSPCLPSDRVASLLRSRARVQDFKLSLSTILPAQLHWSS